MTEDRLYEIEKLPLKFKAKYIDLARAKSEADVNKLMI